MTRGQAGREKALQDYTGAAMRVRYNAARCAVPIRTLGANPWRHATFAVVPRPWDRPAGRFLFLPYRPPGLESLNLSDRLPLELYLSVNSTFADLGLADSLLRAIAETGYTAPTPIQAQAIPLVLQGGDLLAAAQTGTGKTAGFTLPILHLLMQTKPALRKPGRPRCLILTPTRELAAQVEESVRTYGKHTKMRTMVMFGGVNINPQISALRKPLDILVATPGRLLDHAGQKTVDLSGVEILVLDEADRMLDMGFIRDIRKVLALLPTQRQNLLFSATFSDEIRTLARGVLNDPGEVSVTPRNTATELVTQTMYLVEQHHKRDLISHIIRESGWHQVLVFTRTKHGANRLAESSSRTG
jgi:ATP-dependent RNA helicase RhlE